MVITSNGTERLLVICITFSSYHPNRHRPLFPASTWVDLASTGDLNVAAQTNPVTGLQTTTEQTITVYSDGTAGTFNVRVKLIEDDATEHFSSTQEVTVTEVSGPETFYQNTGQAAMSIAGALNKKGYKDTGGHSMELAGTLGTAATFPASVGGNAMSITGTLATVSTFVCVCGGHAMSIAGNLLKKTSKTIGGHAMVIAGSLIKKTSKSMGGYAVSIAGTLSKATIFLQSTGGYAMAISGSLARKTSKTVGDYAVNISGTLIRKTSKTVGGYAMTITGALSTATIFLQTVGGHAMVIAGTLGKIAIYALNVGGYAVNITGSLAKKTSICIGNGIISIAGVVGKVFTGSGGGAVSRGLTKLGMSLKL